MPAQHASWICVTAMCLLLLATPVLGGGAGIGAHPVSSEVASLWVVQDAPGDSPRVVLAFYVGDSGWHDRKWTSNADGNVNKPEETSHDLVSDQLTLSVRLSATGESAFVQGFEFAFAESNVFLVRDIDTELRREDIAPLGHYELNPKDSGILSVTFLLDHPNAAKRIGIDPASITQAVPPDLIAIASGTWGWEAEGATCDSNPHTIEFSPDRQTMTLRYANGVDDQPPTVARYSVIKEADNHIRMKKDAEAALGSNGEPVLWDLVLLAVDSYCWHRSDWQEGGCTQPAKRCSRGASADTHQPSN